MLFDAAFWQPWLHAFVPLTIFGLLGWLYSIYRHNVHIIDSMWSLYFLITAWCVASSQPLTERGVWLLLLAMVWGIRLSLYLAIRNWGKPEDYRYQQIRANNSPHFWFKSLYIVFGLQLILAWIIALPLVAGLHGTAPWSWLDVLGLAVIVSGIAYESIADWQLYRFKRNPANQGKVLDHGLWAWSRHPNYFGEAVTWWGFYLVALAAGGWWTIFSPILMMVLLLRVSGVSLLEQTIHERRPQYRDYIKRTSAFFPLPPRP
ncbi:DUF1295 domain-containing protein [Methylobacillus sp. Pita2]|jgi:steroid 5-alpha reductase family enzyme|uniref:DUF1295 domain-containing protein n=1 Tax=Methylobacillus sp. Pita2 TaxID=3383245 RepID=UPI0038B5BBEA